MVNGTMKPKSPVNLTEIALKSLISSTFLALKLASQDEDASSQQGSCSSSGTPKKRVKRKHSEESTETSDDEIQRKKSRRKSYHSPDSVIKTNEDIFSSKDDNCVSPYSALDIVIVLRNYFNCLPQCMWDRFFELALGAFNETEADYKYNSLGTKFFEFILCKKVNFFSTKSFDVHVYDKYENVVYERLCFCLNLIKLEVYYPYRPNCDEYFLKSLSKLRNLKFITFLPNKKQSFHSSFPIISKSCNLLEELTVMYDSEYLSSQDTNISCLESCPKLRKLILHSFGRGCETEYISTLLQKLKNLRYFFHRELPHSLIDTYLKQYNEDSIVTLNLKVLSLAVYCKGIGSQLCYLPDDSVIQIATVCPSITYLNLIRPSNLALITQYVQCIEHLVIHDWDTQESFQASSFTNQLLNLQTLSIKNTEYIDYEIILQLSKCCPNLRELEIVHTNLFWSNHFIQDSKNGFRNLQKLTLLKTSRKDQMEPKFVNPHKMHIDKFLLKFLLTNSSNLQQLYLEFDNDSVRSMDAQSITSESDLINLISGCSNMKDLMLLSCPNVSFRLIESLTSACQQLERLWDINLWEIPPPEMDRILRRFSHMFVQS